MSFDLRIPKPPRGAAARAADDQDDEADPPLVSTFPLVTARAIITALTIMVMHATVVSLMKICETIVPLGGGRSRHCTREMGSIVVETRCSCADAEWQTEQCMHGAVRGECKRTNILTSTCCRTRR